MSTNLEYRAGERERKGESWWQASKAEWEKGWQSSRARDKNKGDIFLLEEQHEILVAVVTKWKID